MPICGKKPNPNNSFRKMSTCGSFSQDAYKAFTSGMENPTNFMVMGPAAHSRPTTPPSSFFADSDQECGPCGDDDEGEDEGWYPEDEDEEGEEEEYEPNAKMAMGQLRSMAQDIMDILSEITPDDYLEPWAAAKITMSKQNLSAVADYLRFSD